MVRRLTLITGWPGARLRPAATFYEQRSRRLLPERYDLESEFAKQVYARGEHPDVRALHDGVLADAQRTWVVDDVPEWYDPPFPGPFEILERFDEDADVVVADHRLCVFLPLWLPFAIRLVICDVDPEESVRYIHVRDPLGGDEAFARRVRDHYAERLERSSVGLPQLRLSVDEIASGEYARRLEADRFEIPGFGDWPC